MAPRPMTFDHLQSKKKPLILTESFVLDPDRAEELAEAEAQLKLAEAQAVTFKSPEAVKAHEAAQKAYDKIREAALEDGIVAVFKFKSLPRERFEELIDAHQPTKEQQEASEEKGTGRLGWNPDTFPPALMAAVIIEPEMTVEQATMLWNDPNWSHIELMNLLDFCLAVNQRRQVVSLGEGFGGTPGSNGKRRTPSRKASR